MALKFLDSMCFNFISKLERTATTLPLSNSDKQVLCAELGTDDHSYLTISSPSGTEVVRVTCVDGEIVAERGQGSTEAMTHAVNRCACFKINELVLQEYVNPPELCQTVIEVGSGSDLIAVSRPDEVNEPCRWVIEIDSEMLSCIEGLCDEDECDPCVLPDGTYENATLTIRGGKVCGIANGSNIVYTGGSCCGCSSCQPEEDTP